MTLFRRAAPALLLPLVLLTACGGDSDSSDSASSGPTASPTPTGLPKAEFVTQAEAICTKANADIEAQPAPKAIADIGTSLDATLALADGATTELEALAAAQPDKAEIDTIFLTPLRGQVTAIRAYLPQVKAAAVKSEAALDALKDPELPKADLAAMKAYGFKACVETAENE